MSEVREMTKVEFENGRWFVMLLSSVTGKWMPVGVWLTKEDAESDRRNWL